MTRHTRITPQLLTKAVEAAHATGNTFELKDGFNCITVKEYLADYSLYDIREFPDTEFTPTRVRRHVHEWLNNRIADATYWRAINTDALRNYYGQPTLTML